MRRGMPRMPTQCHGKVVTIMPSTSVMATEKPDMSVSALPNSNAVNIAQPGSWTTVAVAGTHGKTTTTSMIADLQGGAVQRAPGACREVRAVHRGKGANEQ